MKKLRLLAPVLAGFVIGFAVEAATPGAPVSDGFNQKQLNTALWTFLNPAGGSYAMTGTHLKLNVPGGKNHDPAFGGMDNSVRVRQTIGNGDFTVTTRFDSIPALQYQFQGVIVEQDATNYLRFQFGSNGAMLVCNVDSLIGGVETSRATATLTPGSARSFWLTIARAGSSWTESYSFDGLTYIAVGSFTQTLTTSGIGPFGGNYNATASAAPAFSAMVNSFTTGTVVIPPPPPPPPGRTVINGPLNISGQSGTTYENYLITNPNGPCVTVTNSTNITIHNSEVGPCGAQAIVTSGGSNVKILDSYLHAETPGIVNRSGNQTTFDTGDNIYCANTASLLIQGNVIGWGEANVFLQGCASAVFKGNFCFNPITSTNLGDRGQCIQVLDGSRNVTVDQNYVLASTDTAMWKYATYSSDMINFGSTGSAPVDGFTVTGNYITGGTFVYGCGIIADGGTSSSTGSTPSVITGNNLVNVMTCGISIEGGYNYTISNNKVFNQNALNFSSNNAFELFSCYNGPGSACYNGEILPCGNITLTGNLGYAINNAGAVSGLYTGGNFPCNPVTIGAGNQFDSAPNQAAYNAMNPPAKTMPPPAIPPVPYSCAVVSPYTTNTSSPPCRTS